MKIHHYSILIATVLAVVSSSALAQDSFGGSQPQQGYPTEQGMQQPGGYPQQPGGYPQGGGYPPQPGGYPQQPGNYPQQPSAYPQQPNGYPQPPGNYPQQPGGYPQGGGYPPQPSGYPQQPGGYPQGSGYPPQPSGYPQQPGNYPQQPGGYPQPPGAGGQANLDQMMQMERQDFGVQPTKQLYSGQMHGPTPASIPGGQVITTKGLVALVQGNQSPYLLFDVLGGVETLPGALPASAASQPGNFADQTQQQFGAFLQQRTGGRKDIPLIFYCLSTQCWMSYNAALRAINMGYTNVLWYRGGIEAWKMAGLPTQQGFGQQFQNPGQQGGYLNQPQQR
jgi:PQQ-dependent catabolism-associated CXXCW motif protein